MERILKTDDARQRLWGIALVGDEFDVQGDRVSDQEIEDASVRAVTKGVAVKIDHAGGAVGRLVASYPLTKSIADAMGIARPEGKSVWLVGLQIDDAQTWGEVTKNGLGHALSIGGSGQRSKAA